MPGARHTPVPEAEWLNRTINIDTGCVFGGKLTALRYPENELLSVPAARVYSEPVKPLFENSKIRSSQHEADDILDISDVIGKRIIHTSLRGNITVREENSIAALEVMSRFAVNPKWLIYLPPTMSPCETSSEDGLLEHPAEAFKYYAKRGVEQVVCEEKHMGSRAIIVVCKNSEVAKKRFGIVGDEIGECYTRTGRAFFKDTSVRDKLLAEMVNSLDNTNFWDEFNTDWVCLDCEIMPWSEKAQELLRQQYAAVGAASTSALTEVVKSLHRASTRDLDIDDMRVWYDAGLHMSKQFINSYQNYCWTVSNWVDYRIAPFHILATEGKVYNDQDHEWHMQEISKICAESSRKLLSTSYKILRLADEDQIAKGIDWWSDLTANGGEGMVVKPYNFTVKERKGLLQPAVKCRGEGYLRIIYGPEYTRKEHIDRLRDRGLNRKRSLALREFALGIEALERFVKKEPLRKVHECVFGVLALESEPVDPRL